MTSRFVAAGMMVLSLLAGRAAESWLIPERFEVTPGATLQLDISAIGPYSAKRPVEQGAGAERVSYTLSRLGDENLEIRPPEVSGSGIRFSIPLKRPGLAAIVIGLKPVIAEMPPEVLEENLRNLYLGERVKEDLIAKIGQRHWRKSTRLHAKVFVRVGLPVETDGGWEKVLGRDLELVTRRNPTTLQVGALLPVRVLFQGAAVANMAVNFRTFDGAHQHVAYTDEDGQVEATLGVAGKWLVFGTILQSSVGAGDLDLIMDQTVLTVEVR